MKKILFLTLAIITLSCTSKEEITEEAEVTITKPSVNSIPDGEFISHFPNGKTKVKGVNANGKRTGTWISYFQTGNKQSENVYINGVKNGKTVSYYRTGQIRYIGYYKNDKKDGTWEFYLENGTAERTVSF